MNKNFFKCMLTFMMVTVLSIGFVSCSEDDELPKPEDKESALVGTWVCDWEEDGEKGKVYVTFKGDGTFAMGAFGFLKIKNHDEIKTQVEEYEKQGLRVIIFAKSNKKITNNKLPKKSQINSFKNDYGYLIEDFLAYTVNFAEKYGLVDFEVVSLDSTTIESSVDEYRRLSYDKLCYI